MKTLLAIMVFVGLLCYPGARDTQGDSEEVTYCRFRGGNPDLAQFKPRELIEELRFRGYHGELKLTQTIKV